MNEDALPYLSEALHVEAIRDAVSVKDAYEIVDLLVNTQQRLSAGAALGVPVSSNHASLRALRKNIEGRGLGNNQEFGILCHKMSLLYLHETHGDPQALKRAHRLAKKSVELLRQHGSDGNWLQMAEMHLRMVASARSNAVR